MEQNLDQINEQETEVTEPEAELVEEIPEPEPAEDAVSPTESEHLCDICGVAGESTRVNLQGINYCPSCWEKHFRGERIGKADMLLGIYNGEIDKNTVSENYLVWASKTWNSLRETFVIPEEELVVIEREAAERGILLPVPEDEQWTQ